MLRKLTIISMVVVLGLAVFAGCSDDKVTTGSNTGFLEEPAIRGYVYLDDEPVLAFEGKVTAYGPATFSDETNTEGYYYVLVSPNQTYDVKCELRDATSWPYEILDTQWEYDVEVGTGPVDLHWYFYSK